MLRGLCSRVCRAAMEEGRGVIQAEQRPVGVVRSDHPSYGLVVFRPSSGCFQAGFHWGQRECGLPGALSLRLFLPGGVLGVLALGRQPLAPGRAVLPSHCPHTRPVSPSLREDLAGLGLSERGPCSHPCSLQGTLRLVPESRPGAEQAELTSPGEGVVHSSDAPPQVILGGHLAASLASGTSVLHVQGACCLASPHFHVGVLPADSPWIALERK